MKKSQIDEFRICFREMREITSLPFSVATPYLQKYLVIRCCSLIETIFKDILFEKVQTGSLPETKNYLKKYTLDSSMNPSTKNIKALLDKFSGIWGLNFEIFCKTNTQFRDELNSLVACRNCIAHGSSTSIPSFNFIYDYFISGIRILIKVEQIII